MAKTISKRGQTIDFDLMRIHQSLSNAEAPSVVIQRQASIEDRLQQRRLQRQNLRNKKKDQMLEADQPTVELLPVPVIDEYEESSVEETVEVKPISKRPRKIEGDGVNE